MKTSPDRYTPLKTAFGYLLLTVLLFLSIGYIYREMQTLTRRSGDEETLVVRRRITNRIIGRLYEAEVIGQSLSTGRLEEYSRYKAAMKQAGEALDSLRLLLTDSTQAARLDTVGLLFIEKGKNMRQLLKAIQDGGTDRIYKEHIDRLIAEQDSLLALPHIRRKVVTHTNSYVIHKKPKGFFRRLGEVFSPDKNDSTRVDNTIQEEYTDTLAEAYSPADTVATLLKDIQNRVSGTHRERMETVTRQTQSLRLNGLRLSRKVNQLLGNIEEEEQKIALRKHLQEAYIRQNSVRTLAGIAITAVVLAAFFLILTIRDLTRSRHYRQELEKAKRRAEDLLVERERLMLTITHDIKAPAGSIVGYADLMERITTDGRQRFYLDNMQSSARHLLSLVNSLLDYHRLDAHKMEVNRVAFNPYQLFDAIRVSFEPAAATKHLALHYDCHPSLNHSFIGDPFRIRQIAENLLSNALKFTGQGSVTLRATLSEGALCFSVSDTGCGISPEEQERIFREFTRLRNAQGQEGFGLGLAITRKLVELLGGNIRVESRQGEGSSFHVCLPLPKNTAAPTASAASEEHTDKEPSPLRLLLIDDDRIQLQLTTAMLERPGVTMACCRRPEELFEYLKEAPFDALLTDLQMPAMNGFELLKAIRSLEVPQAKTLPVIVITARSDMEDSDLRAQGFAGCLHKPFTANELSAVLLQSIGKPLPALRESHAAPLPENNRPQGKWNFSALTAFSEGDAEASAGILRTFIHETEKNRRLMEQALEEKDPLALGELAHKLLPLFTLLEAASSLPILAWLEKQRDAETLVPETDEKVRLIMKEMEEMIQEARRQL